jgi:DNA-binding LacI/PurR family transcriptional regulator
VIAFDDLQCNDLVYPRLTTIKKDYALAAERALEILWSDATTVIRETIPPTIDIRESTAPLTAQTKNLPSNP